LPAFFGKVIKVVSLQMISSMMMEGAGFLSESDCGRASLLSSDSSFFSPLSLRGGIVIVILLRRTLVTRCGNRIIPRRPMANEKLSI